MYIMFLFVSDGGEGMLMKRFFLLFYLFVFVTLAGCGTSAVIKDVQDIEIEELNLTAATNSKPIQLSKIVVKLKRGEHVGAAQAGMLCVPHADLNWRGGSLNIDSSEFTETFKEELEKYSFKTVGDPNALFEDPSSWKAEILVAGLVNELKANVCFPYAGFGNYSSTKGEAFVKVEWQIYSKLDRSVVHTVATEGAYKSTETNQGGLDEIIMNAFSQAARHLLADKKFREIVIRGGEQVKDTVFKTEDQMRIVVGNAKAMTARTSEWKDGVATVFAGTGHGSGFAISDNLILTNHHVVGESNRVVVKFGSELETTGQVIAYNSGYDTALIKVDVPLPRYFKIERKLPEIGSDIYALGSPLSDDLNATLTRGVVSGIRQEFGKKLIQSDVNIAPGSSGGPLLNSSGKVVGIAVSGIQINKSMQGINFFIPIEEALNSIELK